jgi:pentose-5-phosphate-3-epimerase
MPVSITTQRSQEVIDIFDNPVVDVIVICPFCDHTIKAKYLTPISNHLIVQNPCPHFNGFWSGGKFITVAHFEGPVELLGDANIKGE